AAGLGRQPRLAGSRRGADPDGAGRGALRLRRRRPAHADARRGDCLALRPADGPAARRRGGRRGAAHRRVGGDGGRDRLRGAGGAAHGARLGVRRSGSHAGPVGVRRGDSADPRRPCGAGDPLRRGAAARGRHRPLRRAAVRTDRLARGEELARMTAVLELEGLTVRRGRRDVLADVTLDVAAGEMLGLVGPNGAGKTTLLRAALGLQPRAAGAVRLAGRPLEALSERERAAVAGYLPQERRVAWNMPALDVAALGAGALGPHEGRALALDCLTELEVGDLAGRGVLDMSGGERARVLLARLLATRAKLLVADEPAAGLDTEAQLLILERLRARAVAGAAVVVTSHDLA